MSSLYVDSSFLVHEWTFEVAKLHVMCSLFDVNGLHTTKCFLPIRIHFCQCYTVHNDLAFCGQLAACGCQGC